MKLLLREALFSWTDRFVVWDEYGEERYYVDGELLSLGKKLHVTNRNGEEVALVQEKILSLLSKYLVIMNGEQVAEIVEKLTLFRPKYSIEGPGWRVEGSMMEHDYQILDGERPIVTIHKQWMSWADCYELDIDDSVDEVMALVVVLAIDCVLADEEQAAASSAAGH